MSRGVEHGVLVPADEAEITGVEEAGEGLAALGAGDVAVTVGGKHGVHDLLFLHLDNLESPFTCGLHEASGESLHAGEGDGVADHGGLGDARLHGHGLPLAFPLGGFVVSVDRVSVLALHAEDTRQAVDDAEVVHFEEAGHDGGDVAGVAHGHEEAEILHVPAVPLGYFVGVGLLTKDTPGVLGVEKGHAVFLGEDFDDLHAVVKDAGKLEHCGAAAKGLGKLLRGHLAVRQEHDALQGGADIGGVERRRGGRIARGGADRDHLVPVMMAAEPFQIAEGAGHAAVFEGGAGILAVVLEGEGNAGLFLHEIRGLDDGGQALPEVDDVLFVKDGSQELIVAEHAPQGVPAGGGPGIEEVTPVLAVLLFELVELFVLEKQDIAAFRAGVEQAVGRIAPAAAEAVVFHLTAVGGKIVGHEKTPYSKKIGRKTGRQRLARLMALQEALLRAVPQTLNILPVPPDHDGQHAEGKRQPLKVPEEAEQDGHGADQGEGACGHELRTPDHDKAEKAGDEQGGEGDGQEDTDARGNGLAAFEIHEAGEHVAEHGAEGGHGDDHGRPGLHLGQEDGERAL